MPHIRVEDPLIPRAAVQDARFRPFEILAGHGHQIDDAGKGIGSPEHRTRAAEDLDAL